ncbi:MAG TPA: PQQ-binding-like beta-propeller repeat protein [Acidobacteriaceae bacterium]|nr:PQQ-binding-like beta-propeller repeat protein [Acidobacteriaceae bacterium]
MSRARLVWTISALFCMIGARITCAQAAFPRANFALYDAKHKDSRSGVQVRDGEITIRSGVGTPTVINALAFSRDSTLLVAGKDFGRVVLWSIADRSIIRAIHTGQGIVSAVAISPDDQLIATGAADGGDVKIWHAPDGKLLNTIRTVRPGSGVRSLMFSLDSQSLIVSENQGGTSYVLDTKSGRHVVELSGERMPTLSNDGKTLLTTTDSELVLRSTDDWRVSGELRKLTPYVWPETLDAAQKVYIFGDPTDENSFVAVDLKTGQMLPNPRPVKLPRWNPAAGGFAALDPMSGLVFGHSSARLWAWNPKNGATCVSDVLYSESGALSPDGTLLAGAIDNSFFAPGKNRPGVLVWKTATLRASCAM